MSTVTQSAAAAASKHTGSTVARLIAPTGTMPRYLSMIVSLYETRIATYVTRCFQQCGRQIRHHSHHTHHAQHPVQHHVGEMFEDSHEQEPFSPSSYYYMGAIQFQLLNLPLVVSPSETEASLEVAGKSEEALLAAEGQQKEVSSAAKQAAMRLTRIFPGVFTVGKQQIPFVAECSFRSRGIVHVDLFIAKASFFKKS